MTLIYPDGAQFHFVERSAGNWSPETSLTDKLAVEGDGFRLDQRDGTQYFFKKRGTATSPIYLMEEMRDAVGNSYRLEYNSSRQVTKITEPGGRFFSVAYRTLTGSKLNPSTLATLAAVPAAGTWSELTISNPNAFRFVRLVQADKSFGQIAEVEFYEAGTGAKLSGQVICSDSAAAGQAAMDGAATTGFVSAAQSGGFVGLDLGTAKKIGRVRFLSVAGKEALHKPTGWSQAAVRIEGANEAPVSTLAIASVQTNDGRSATYEYAPIVDPTLPYTFPALTSVLYSDGARSTYKHVQVFPGTRPLISEWDDVRYDLRQGRYKSVYQNSVSGAVLGAVVEQTNLETGRPIMTIGLNNNNLHQPMVTHGNGGSEVQIYSTSLPTGAAIVQEIDENKNSTFYTYDANGYMATKKDPLGRITSYTWTREGNPLTQTNPDGSVERWTYNAANLPVSHTDTLGRTTTHTRDERNRVIRIDYPDGTFESFQHNAYGQITEHRQRNGSVTISAYAANGLLTQSTDPLGNTTTYGYDAAGRLTRVTDALGRTTSMEYNDRGLVTKITNPDATFRTRTYTPYGDLANETNELGHTWTYTYDVFRRLTSSTDPLGRTARTEYHPDAYQDAPLSVTAPSGVKTAFTYDLGWRLLSRIEGAGTPVAATTTMAYDKGDNLLSVTDAMGKTTLLTYDNRDRKATATDPLGNITRWTYDTESHVITETRPDGGVTRNEYDTMNRMVKTTDAKGQSTTMAYDASDNLVGLTDARGNTYTRFFDAMDRLTAMLYPGGSREQYRYDAVGNPVGYTTRAGQIRTSVFDNRNREIQTNWSDDTPDITRSFDAVGRVLSEDNGAVVLTYTYNAANQVLSETTQLTAQPARTVGYAYDAAGRLASTTYPGGNVVAQTYTPRGQIAGIGLDGGTVASYQYNPVGATTAKTYENGLSALYSYDAAQRLIALEHRRGLDLLAKIDYTLDKVGNRKSKAQSVLNPITENYNYDAVDQLIEAKYGAARTVGYQYDAVGNRQWVSDNGTTAHYTANSDNGYTSVDGVSTETDLNGNMVSVPGGAYAYDAQNRLTSATVNGVTTEFTYDSRNRVVQRTSGNGTLNMTYSGWHLIEERNATGALEQVYVHGAGTDEILVKITTSGQAYYHHDGLGSTVALTGENGELLESYRYDAFGEASVYDYSGSALPASPRGNRFLFTGREWLPQVGLYDYRNRVYSTQIGRFLQTDPIRFAAGDVNIYRYVGNNPVNLWDPWGLCEEDSYSWNDLLLDLASLGLTAADLALGGPTGEGIGPALAIQAAKQAAKEAKNQVKKLTKQEIKNLQKKGHDIHDLKGDKNASRRDLFKDGKGNVEVRPKNGQGPGEPTGINVND
jgi:RHS repeat-associated protein